MLYEVAIIQKPKNKKEKEILVLAPIALIADSDEAASNKALLENRDKLADGTDLDRIEVLVRPFV